MGMVYWPYFLASLVGPIWLVAILWWVGARFIEMPI